MKIISTRFHRKIDNAVARFTELGSEIALQDFELLDPFGGNAFVPLRIWRDQRYRHTIDENVGSSHLPAVNLKIICRVASWVIAHITHESRYQGDELNRVAKRSGHFQGKVV